MMNISLPLRRIRVGIAAVIIGGCGCLAEDSNEVRKPEAPPTFRFATAPAEAEAIVAGRAPADMLIGSPLAMYQGNPDRQSLDAKNFATAVQLIGYYYPLMQNGRLTAVVNLQADPTTGKVSFRSLALRPAPNIMEAVNSAAKSPGVGVGLYEVRILSYGDRPNSAFTTVLWLKSVSGAADLIYVPSERLGAVPLYVPGRISTLADFLAEFRKIALQRQAANAKAAAPIEANRRRAADGEDTSTTRMLALSTTLAQTLKYLQLAPPASDKSFDQPRADLVRAQASVERGLDYLKVHPNDVRLESAPEDNGPQRFLELGYPWITERATWLSIGRPAASVCPSLYLAGRSLQDGFRAFMGDPSMGLASLGAIGGYRDKILRDVAIAELDLAKCIADFALIDPLLDPILSQRAKDYARRLKPGFIGVPPLAEFASTANLGRPGSISGTVTRPDGNVTGPVVITFIAVDSLQVVKSNPSLKDGKFAELLPGTISDTNGSFTIGDIPPALYYVTVGRDGPATVVEVKNGQESKLTAPLMLIPYSGQYRFTNSGNQNQ